MIDIQRIRNNIDNFYKNKQQEHNKERDNKRNSKWNKYYDNKYWKQLRNTYYTEHPLCECCLNKDIITPAEDIHHIKKFSSGITDTAKWNLLLNYNNLIALCKYHHKLAHNYMERNNTDKAGIDEILQMEQQLNR